MRDKVRARHETANRRFKIFGILSQRYRHDLSDHGYFLRGVAVLTQLSIEEGEELFAVDYNDK